MSTKVENSTKVQHDAKLPVVCSASDIEAQIKEIGFKLYDNYKHDNYRTKIYRKNCLKVEFTYENEQLLTCDLTIHELNNMPISFSEIQNVTKLLGHWQE